MKCVRLESESEFHDTCPVAGELRQVVTAIRLTANLPRVAVLASHIAAARRRHPEPVIPEPVRPLISRTGAIAIASSAAAVLDSPDPQTASMLDGQDDIMDRLHEQLLAAVLDPRASTRSPPRST